MIINIQKRKLNIFTLEKLANYRFFVWFGCYIWLI